MPKYLVTRRVHEEMIVEAEDE